ncbi:MAG: hypothetical protein ACHRXM_03115 [Isosphaerales bacterium]
MSVFGERPNGFPKLPILNAAVPARSQREKYGGLYYLGIAGLVVVLALVGWFAHAVWSHRTIWADIYTLHDSRRSETDRLQAAFRLSRDQRVSDSQLLETCLRRDLPVLARYLLAEAVSTDAVARDPRGYALTAARSPDWPHWLRLLLARRLAYGAARGYAIPREALDELAKHADPMIGLWADCSLALRSGTEPRQTDALDEAAQVRDENGELASMLLATLTAPREERERRLDEATIWLRHHHRQAAQIWRGWEIRDGRLLGDL